MQINEGLKAGDLEGVIDKRFSIDQFKSKMGDDKNIMVLAFTAEGLAPAKDLERFAETGYKEILDADATPGTMADGKHKVFIEFARQDGVITHIMKFLEDLKKLTNIEEFEYTYHKGQNPTLVSAGTMQEMVPTTPDAYEQKVNEMKMGEAKNFFDKYDMLECKMQDNILSVKKTGSQQELKFEIHKVGNTNEIMQEAKAFALDMNAIAECTHLTKYFGPYNITKTTENKFIFNKGNESAVLSKHGW
tara:strand:+ start:2221 stop:2961 length:741 start_codon:yes stop_codon:yes gene_type:complete